MGSAGSGMGGGGGGGAGNFGTAFAGFATMALGNVEASVKAREAAEDAQDEQRVLSYNAQVAAERGRFEAAMIRMSGTQLIAQQKVGYANSGVAIDTGTAASVMASQAALTELDAKTAENNAAAEVWGYRLHRKQSERNLERKYDAAERELLGAMAEGTALVISSTQSG